jgi:hypothetical protein
MTVEEFVSRCEAACAGLALLFANAPEDVFKRGLEHFTANVRDALTERLGDYMAPEKIAELVKAMRHDARLRRREVQLLGPVAGNA